jgi:hypothetical protein
MSSDSLLNDPADRIEDSARQYFEMIDVDDDNRDMSVPSSNFIGEHPSLCIVQSGSIDEQTLNRLHDDCFALDIELRSFESKHKEYVTKLDDVESLKTKYRLELDKYKKKIDQLQDELRCLKTSYGEQGTDQSFIENQTFEVKMNPKLTHIATIDTSLFDS